jgi:LPS O-antigen subunit length determinant protein (WzzB/FepE family)
MALALLRRYPVLTSLLGLTTPLLRRRPGLRRVLILAAFVGGLLAAGRARVRQAPSASPR